MQGRGARCRRGLLARLRFADTVQNAARIRPDGQSATDDIES
jgi:hypothetical protein